MNTFFYLELLRGRIQRSNAFNRILNLDHCEAVDVMSRVCPFEIMGSSDECLGCHSVHPRLESRLKFRVCVPREGQLNFRAGDFDQAVPLLSSRVSHAKRHRHIHNPRGTRA